MKPLFMWAGGKNKLIKHYQPYFPVDVENYCEPFFGGGAMFIYVMNTYKPSSATINDVNEDVINIYKSIKSNLPEFLDRLDYLQAQYIPKTKEDRKTYYYEVRHSHAYDYKKWSKPYEAATLYFLMKTGFNGIYQLNNNTNGRYGTPSGLLNQKTTVYDKTVVDWWHNSLQVTNIKNGDWKHACGHPKETFHFFDPPYRDSFADYGNGFSDRQLIELIKFSDTCDNVMLSNRDDDGWFTDNKMGLDSVHIDVTYTAGRRKKTEDGFKAKKAKEILLYRTDAKNMDLTQFF
tara:strand:- start:96 stop:965 length:870 start_codon:yes stop_codon:yes gene_type:complete